jgi:hypothetical protein
MPSDNHRFTFHFTPTSCSWLNAVEAIFAKLSKRRLKRGVFHSVVHLQAAINRYLAEHNRQPKPFIWTANPDDIIAAVERGHRVLDSIHRHPSSLRLRTARRLPPQLQQWSWCDPPG